MAFKRWNKAPSRKPPIKIWETNEMKIIGWCLNNNIAIGISQQAADLKENGALVQGISDKFAEMKNNILADLK